ncbi:MULTISPECIES: AAA family ATPase [Flavobacterium]|uniref:AAA+ ATPase domain-containing protein n=1 Tax=Flavobacterium hankyongi TaxID=1176532 RepID=A0ABP8ZQ14_9FLAO|nr:AAA family ATPase [Flavobacterium sp. N1846]
MEKVPFSYYASLEVGGVNCFKDNQKLELSNQSDYYKWTIILGDNGTGKTTLLKILDKLQPDPKSVDNNGIEIFIPKYFIGGITNDNKLILEDLKAKKIDLILELISSKKKSKITISSKTNNYSLYNSDFKETFILSYGASRRMSKNQSLQTSVRSFTNSLFDDSIELINAEEWFLQKEYAVLKSSRSSKPKFEREFNLVKELLIDILPDVTDIHSRTFDEEISKPSIEVETSFGWINIRNLSFGYQTLSALIVDIAANMMEKYPDSNNPLGEPVIILIDEIDLHLHPKWQREVLDKFSTYFPNAQFIVTAHSPLIAQAAQDKNANIVVCRKEGDKVVIDNKPENVKGWRIDQILTSDLFEVSSSQSNKIEKLRDEKISFLLKNKLTKQEKERLSLINEELLSVPSFDDKESNDAESLIRKAASIIRKK